jgi:hypothetical protein
LNCKATDGGYLRHIAVLDKAASVGGLSYFGRGAEAPALILALQFCTAYPHFYTFSQQRISDKA